MAETLDGELLPGAGSAGATDAVAGGALPSASGASSLAVDASGAPGESKCYQFFNHAACEFYPCHDMPAEELNCLFCFCPLYALGPACGGNYRYVGEHGDIKDCSACTVPHRRENYDWLMGRYVEIQRLAAPKGA